MRAESFLRAALAASLLALAACATPDRIILLPQPDGSPSAIFVRTQTGEAVLNQPYATAEVSARRIAPGSTNADEVDKRYRVLADALPPRPRVYLLYFESGGDRLTTESAGRIADILTDLQKVPAAELLVVGHTDRVGGDALNDELSLQRATTIRALLLEKSGKPLVIEAVGRGKRDLLVPTPEGVAEPKNRRVEIRLR